MENGASAAFLQLAPIIFLFVVFYFLLIRPQKKKQVEHLKMVQGIKKNDEIVTIGGIHGTVVNIKETTFVVRVDDNARVELDKNSVASVKK